MMDRVLVEMAKVYEPLNTFALEIAYEKTDR
jgi:hypothetical protein